VVVAVAGTVLFTFFPEPSELLQRNWIVTLVAVPAAAIANATAIGGGFLFLPLFLFVFQLNAYQGLQLALATQAFGMTSGAVGWSPKLILMRSLVMAAIASGFGMAVGTFLFPADPAQIKAFFGWVSVGIGLAIIAEIKLGESKTAEEIQDDSLLKQAGFMIACFLGGIVNSWVSIGIGEVVALYLLFVYRVRIDIAIGTGVATLAADSVLGFMFHIGVGGIRWEYLVFTAPGVIVGGRYGARIARWLEGRRRAAQGDPETSDAAAVSPLKKLFVVIVIVDGLAMLLQPSIAVLLR
jgi:uncharacterized membrane protein YfcA